MRNVRFFLALVVLLPFTILPAIAAYPVPLPIQNLLRIVPIIQAESVESILQTAMSLYSQQKFDEALEKCQQATRLTPQDHRPLALIGFIYMGQLKMKSASESFAKAIQLQPQNKYLYLSKASADFHRNARDEAAVSAQRAIEIDPSYTEAYALLGDALRWNEARKNEAISAYRKALVLNPKFLLTYEPLGELLFELGDTKDAEEILRRGMDTDPKNMTGRFTLGRKLVKLGRLTEARELWNGRTADIDNTRPKFITVLERAEKLQKAKDDLSKNPKSPELLVNLGFAVMDGDPWIMDKRQEHAIEYFKQALAINPKFARAQYGICKAYIQLANHPLGSKLNVNTEISKLRKMNPELAKEIDEYQKNGGEGRPGGIIFGTLNQ